MGSLTAIFYRLTCDLEEKGHTQEYILRALEEMANTTRTWQTYSQEERAEKFKRIIQQVVSL